LTVLAHPSLVFAATIALAFVLAAISLSDFRGQIIPDGLNLALAGVGLFYQLAADADDLPMHLLFAAATFTAAWLLRRGHFLITGRIGLGLGDVKMLAAASCWVSPLLLPVLLFIASASALLYVGGLVAATGPAAARARVAFGPFIAIGLGSSWALEQFAGLNMGLL
jgi:leader peptidase (prepilin peptidase)/N-methyltransferase